MKRISSLATLVFLHCIIYAQVEFDLSSSVSSVETISLDFRKNIKIKNMCINPKYKYTYTLQVVTSTIPPFDNIGLSGAACASRENDSNNQAYQSAKNLLKNETEESQIPFRINELSNKIKKLDTALDQGCIKEGNDLIKNTVFEKPIPLDLKQNQIITVTVIRKTSDTDSNPIIWTKMYKTEQKTRWLVHYGLTYAPSFISKTNNFFSLADTSVANRYTITKSNSNGPKPWDNISATINFTYPFHADSRPFDGGFTAGFGISTGLGLSGHAGLSAIIGDNVIISSGLVFMQKQKLKGQYKEGQIIKENLAFDALHEKVWLPEMFFTIGFRFGSNPFATKPTASTPTSSTPAP